MNLPDANPNYKAPELTEESSIEAFEQVASQPTTEQSVNLTAKGLDIKGGNVHIESNPTTVQAVNEAVLEAGEMELTPKQQEKKDKEDKKYWNGMVTRKELAGLMQANGKEIESRLQILYVQNATLLEVFKAKGLISEQDMIDASKKVMEDLFGILPEDLEAPVETPEV